MRDQGLGSWPVRRRRLSPAHVAFVQGDTRRSYAALDDRTRHLAAALRDLGVQRGDRVAYLGPNDPTLLETLFATTALGGVFVPLNWRLTVPELAYIAADCGATVLVHAAAMADAAAAVAADGSTALPRLVELGPAFEGMATGGGAGGDVPAPIDTPVALDDPAVIVYTSGTTGRPKGATLSHGNITWNCVNVLVDTDLASDEVALVCAPLFHVAALNMVSLPMVMKGGTIVLTGAFDPDSVLELIARHRVTVMFGVPSMFNAMAQAPAFASADLSSLRRLLCGGAPVPLSTIRTYLDRDIPFLQGYGMTETSPGALFLGAEHAADKAGSAGVASFFTDVRVVRPDGREVVPGEKGEVVVAGPNVMRGYWNRPEATAGVMDGEWFRSGDVAVVDDDGYVTIVDRMKDVIISGGENIYPAEVEDVIYGHPDVAECAVIGVPDERWGEVGRVIVVRRAGAALDERGLLEHLDGRLARFKLPRSVVFTDRLPRSGAGKVLKADLRAEFGAP
ncbi:MAG TPA: long-chain fatty acid--CoA ligase [Acidimicrobiales bacterium]|jgi:fatty-acyl-CoA synthase|nr:long-chain fatty acid--CoA ligase [Acidimicrobiales bacterium]